VEESRLLIST